MDNKIKKLLFDIQSSIHNIETFTEKITFYEEYEKDTMLQQAVERNFEIIGEAMSKILKLQPDIPITSARKVVDTRNKLIHNYDEIEAENIWIIVIDHLPLLKLEVELLLKAK